MQWPKDWKGWGFYECYLVDDAGNRYTPDMVKSSLFTYQLKHELTGSTGQVLSLKNILLTKTQPKRIYLEVTMDRSRNPSVKIMQGEPFGTG
jgi:hypothetical protein